MLYHHNIYRADCWSTWNRSGCEGGKDAGSTVEPSVLELPSNLASRNNLQPDIPIAGRDDLHRCLAGSGASGRDSTGRGEILGKNGAGAWAHKDSKFPTCSKT
jgi:hypothetical protein